MKLDDLNLENLTEEQLRKLITLVTRQTTLKNYKHVCSEQAHCTACGIVLCYACYNRHLSEVHGPKIAQFNEKLNSGSFFLPERKEHATPKTKIKVEVKIKVKHEKKFKTPWGNFTQQEIVKILQSLGE